MLDLQLLYLLLLSGAITTPVYLRMRSRMTHKLHSTDKPLKYYTHRRVVKFTILVIFMGLVLNLFMLAIFLAIKSRDSALGNLSDNDMFTLGLLLAAASIIATGEGLYISSVILERFTLRGLRDDPQFSRQTVATKLFHGPISHIMIYTSMFAGFLILSLTELTHPFRLVDNLTLVGYVVAGILAGLIYYYAQVYNLTWRYQLPGALIVLALHLSVLVGLGGLSLNLPFNLFFLVYELIYVGLLLNRYFYRLLR